MSEKCQHLAPYGIQLPFYDALAHAQGVCDESDVLPLDVEHIKDSALPFGQDNLRQDVVNVCSVSLLEERVDFPYSVKHTNPCRITASYAFILLLMKLLLKYFFTKHGLWLILCDMRKSIKFLFLLLCLFLMTSCSDNDSENTASFDPDGIAHVNNGDGVDFSQYENVYEGEVENSDFISNGIVNISWNNENQIYFFVDSDEKEKWRYTALLSTPYFILMDSIKDRHEMYAGTFSLKKRGKDFYITIITNKKCNLTGDGWDSITEKRETHQYIVGDSRLAFLN